MEQKNHHGTDMGLPTAITATDSRMEVSTFGWFLWYEKIGHQS